jgi:predicted negative regulator of RcsB-dependent stress response
LAYFLGRVVSLEQIITWIAQAGIAALAGVIVLLLIPILWEYRQKKLSPKD